MKLKTKKEVLLVRGDVLRFDSERKALDYYRKNRSKMSGQWRVLYEH